MHFSKPAAYITHNAIKPVSDLNGGSSQDCLQLSLDLQKAHIYSSTSQDL